MSRTDEELGPELAAARRAGFDVDAALDATEVAAYRKLRVYDEVIDPMNWDRLSARKRREHRI